MKNPKENIPAGSILLSEKPFVYCLSSKVRTENCDFCFKKGMLLKCTACQYVYYCGKACQKEGWSVHKAECRNLKRIAPRIIPDAARMLARLVRRLHKNGNQVRSYYSEMNFRMYKDLMSHYPDMKNDAKRMEHFQSLLVVLEEFMKEEILPNPVDLMGMFGRMCINSFNICNEEQQILGTGIYLGASILDHSCEPNAVAIFEGTTIHIRALKTMQYLNWSEVFISYIDILNTTKDRIEDLKRVYYFTCQCQKCLTPDPKEMLAACCPNTNCDNAITPDGEQNCSKCGEHINEEFLVKFREVTELTDLHIQRMKDLAYYDACKICLEKQVGVLHKSNIKHVKTLDLTFESCICLGKFEEAIIIGKKLEGPFHKYYGKFHPLTGLLHLKMGKILIHLNNIDEGMKQVKNAYEILKVTHGIQSGIFRDELLPLLRQY
ncbi:histone-lysine N-methyltransferase SMYD3 [Coccinella septempunctata]|uniref:histone-lysine N-methyltransferase SMYD3 n=1 Tax=Coccinella septempunctata TaxID=41139 RepID=UPI001D05F1F5|nr:histone-lysine N-methyltransferase SMYD3 [Coccinella septempunctata]